MENRTHVVTFKAFTKEESEQKQKAYRELETQVNSGNIDAMRIYAQKAVNGVIKKLCEVTGKDIVWKMFNDEDLTSEAFTYLYEQIIAHGRTLETEYTYTQLAKNVYKGFEYSKPKTVVKTTTVGKELRRVIRRHIQSLQGVDIDDFSCVYLEDTVTTVIDGKEEKVTYWNRLPKYMNLGGTGDGIEFTGDTESATQLRNAIKACNFTARELHIVKQRLSGKSLHEIATDLNISRQAIQNTLKRMQGKVKTAYKNGTGVELVDVME